MPRLSLGIDFGTESVRALLVDIDTGETWTEAISPYASKVMDRELICPASRTIPLPPEFALQNGFDYLDSMTQSVCETITQATRRGKFEILGIGIDFTASTPMPLRQGKPLSAFLPNDPHAYVKLWKHHAAQPQADQINEKAPSELLARYGGSISSEWSLPKLLEVEAHSENAFTQMDLWIEAGDWVVSELVGRADNPVRSRCQAGYKGLWSEMSGYPSPDFLQKLSPKLAARFETLMRGVPQPLGSSAGKLSPQWAEKIGIPNQPTVAVAAIDAHAGVPGSGVASSGEILCVLGTSTCHMALSEDLKMIPGIAGAVADGIIPGLVGYEAGQPAVGDLFSWFAKLSGKPLSPERFQELEAHASQVVPGCNGVLALDWWNGMRIPTMDSNVKGTWVGLRLTTTEAEMYRSLLEATAFGTKLVVDTLTSGGISIPRVVLTGGIAAKSPLLCQIYADVLDQEVTIVEAKQPVALGAAIYGAASALKTSAEDFPLLVKTMTSQVPRRTLNPKNAAQYKKPYEKYRKLQNLLHAFYRE